MLATTLVNISRLLVCILNIALGNHRRVLYKHESTTLDVTSSGWATVVFTFYTARTYHNMYSRSLAVYVVYSTDLCNVQRYRRRRRWPRNQNSLTQLNTRNRVTRPKTQQRKLILNDVQCIYRPRHRTQSSLLHTIFSTLCYV